MHEDNEESDGGDERDADEVEAHGQPTHSTAEEVVGGLVIVQQFLISTKQRQKLFLILARRGQSSFCQDFWAASAFDLAAP